MRSTASSLKFQYILFLPFMPPSSCLYLFLVFWSLQYFPSIFPSITSFKQEVPTQYVTNPASLSSFYWILDVSFSLYTKQSLLVSHRWVQLIFSILLQDLEETVDRNPKQIGRLVGLSFSYTACQWQRICYPSRQPNLCDDAVQRKTDRTRRRGTDSAAPEISRIGVTTMVFQDWQDTEERSRVLNDCEVV